MVTTVAAVVYSADVASYLSGLRNVTSRSYAEAANLSNPTLSVEFNFSNQPEIRVSAFQQPEGWILVSSENVNEKWSDKAAFDKLFAPVSGFKNDDL